MNATAPLESRSEIINDADALATCSKRWEEVAAIIGCSLYGFDDGYSAAFRTPDGNLIQVGSKFRAAISALKEPTT